MTHCITTEHLTTFRKKLHQDEKAASTIEKYCRDVCAFSRWLAERSIDKETVISWRTHLLNEGYAPITINAMLSAINNFFNYMGWQEYRVKFLRIQQQLFREQTKELTQTDYHQLLTTAQQLGKERLALVMETICASGIRVSEIKAITVEAAQRGRTEIALKGKIRVILLPNKLCRKLLKYAKKQKTASGEIFLTKNGHSLSRKQIWLEMKQLCAKTQIEPSKVFPHNLRHLFAVTFYRVSQDMTKLADILGHASIETTRIYLRTTDKEHLQQLEHLELVS